MRLALLCTTAIEMADGRLNAETFTSYSICQSDGTLSPVGMEDKYGKVVPHASIACRSPRAATLATVDGVAE